MAARGYVRRLPRARTVTPTPPTSASLRLAAARKSPEQEDYDAALELHQQQREREQPRHGEGLAVPSLTTVDAMKRAALPSLFKFMPPTSSTAWPTPEAYTAPTITVASEEMPEMPEAGPSSAAATGPSTKPRATRKGKERASLPEFDELAAFDELSLGPTPAPRIKPSRKGKERAAPPPEFEQFASAPASKPVARSKTSLRATTRSKTSAAASAARVPLPSLNDRPPPAAVQSDKSETTGLRRNPVGVQLLSKQMHQQVFPGEPLPQPPEGLLDISKWHLSQHGLSTDGAAVLPEVSFDMPQLEGGNIRDHFHALGAYAAEPYLSMANEFAAADLPPQPERWETARPGWTRYGKDGTVTPVDNLNGETIVSFDVEVLYKLSPYPVMATAASATAWYSWLSPSIFDEPPAQEPPERDPWDKSTPECYPHTLIPLFEGNTRPVIAVGHNVGYDRGRVAEEYALGRTPTRWLDTLSLHVATRGITSVQRPAWMKHKKVKVEKAVHQAETLDLLREEAELTGDTLLAESLTEWSNQLDGTPTVETQTWEDTTSVNSLADVAALHCGIKVDKSVRDRFGDESIRHASQLRPELDDLLTYCATDVKITHDVYKVVLPLFLTSCPHPATFAGVLSMGNSFLPVDKSWEEYLRNAETMYQELREDVRLALRTLADRLREAGPDDTDPWSSQLDWSPKAARWADSSGPASAASLEPKPRSKKTKEVPAWYSPIAADPNSLLDGKYKRYILPLLLQMKFRGYPVAYVAEHYWCFKAPIEDIPELIPLHGAPVELSAKDGNLASDVDTSVFFRVGGPDATRRAQLVGKSNAKDVSVGVLTSAYPDLLPQLTAGNVDAVLDDLVKCAADMLKLGKDNDWASQLDWTPQEPTKLADKTAKAKKVAQFGTWPKWYWDLTVPATNKKVPAGQLDLTMRKSVAPLLLRMQWHGFPLAYSKEHKWIYRVPSAEVSPDPESVLYGEKAVVFSGKVGDEHLEGDVEHAYFRIPHKDGEGNNVGNPLSKAFLRAVESGDLSSALATDEDQQLASAASRAVNMNALCSYWISSRERIMNQFVVYDGAGQGMILPQVITMGTVTRRAVEATWLTASNAKKNRVGSELKSMVRAPPGFAIVGADVDSEELWISSVMGDSQFGVHGATAIGWMTLEGTKSAGTDLHSKTATILKISRDAAKVFNYSRIYGAGKPHAIQLLLQGDGKLTREAADELATALYRQTKGVKTFGARDQAGTNSNYLWHGGSESYLFNTLESIALMDRPTTPALGCGVTRALRKSFLNVGNSYLPSRINWVVQSSGVDYLHLLITAMEYLIAKYGIEARYLLSVHDEVRYLASEEDKLRTALALQIANVWTRALFCYNLGFDDMPQGIAFFSAVDVDHVLRKETDMACMTPSNPEAIAPGESLDIDALLQRTGGRLGAPRAPLDQPLPRPPQTASPVTIFADRNSAAHQRYVTAQADARPQPARAWLSSLGSRRGEAGGSKVRAKV